MPVGLPRQVLTDLAVKTLTTWNQGLHARRALVHMGELSAARQALEGATVAPGTLDILNALQPIPPDIFHAVPAEQFSLDFDVFTRNIRIARRGAAGGLSGMTTEHLSEVHSGVTIRDCSILPGRKIWCEQTSPKTSSCCSVWGVSLHSRNQAVASVQEATSPFQYALTTKAGGECCACYPVSH